MKFTKEQALAITGFTGITAINFSAFHEDVEKRMNRPVFTHEFGCNDVWLEIKNLYKDDFLSMCHTGED